MCQCTSAGVCSEKDSLCKVVEVELHILVLFDTVVTNINCITFVLIPRFQRKLRTFRQEACRASSPQGSAPRTCRSSAAMRTKPRLKTRFHSIRSHLKSLALRTNVKKKQLKRQKRRTELSVFGLTEENQRNKNEHKATSQTTNCNNHDDIDDIFASIGL